MKKFKSILAVILAIAAIFCFAGCGKNNESGDNIPDEEKIIGKWTTEIDCSSYMTGLFESIELNDDVIPADVPMCSYMIFEFDGEKCKMYFDNEKTLDSINTYLESFRQLLADSLYAQFEAGGLDAESANKQFKDYYGISVEEYADLLVTSTLSPDDLLTVIAGDGSAEGFYRLEDDKIYIADSAEELENADYYSYLFFYEELRIYGSSGESFFTDFEEMGISIPLRFTKE